MSQYSKWPAAAGGGGGGTVSSVGLSAPAGLFTVVGSPVTSSGTLTLLLNNEAQNTVFAGPSSGGTGSPTFRLLVASDIPVLPYAGSVLFGSVPNANGGSIAAGVLTLEPADGTHPGGVSILTQSFGGAKTFLSDLAAASTSTTAFTVNSTTLVVDATNNAVGINTAPASNTFIDGVNSTAAAKRIQLTGYGVGSTVGYRGRFARGTSGTPAAAQSGDNLSFFSGQGYGASQFPAASTGAVNILAGETFTDTSSLTYLTVNTTPTGSVTSAEAFRVASTGVTLGPQSSSTASHKINGAIQETINTITATTYSVDATTTDTIIFTDSTSNAITITLPAPTAGRMLTIQDKTGQATTHNITIKQHAAETINGLVQLVIAQNYGSIQLTSDGTNWSAVKSATSGTSLLTSGTTYTTPINVTPQTRFKFTLIGGGGGGGGTNTASANGSGGGGGGTALVFITGLAANTAFSIAVGSGGAGGISTTTPAGAGGSTTLTANAVTYTAAGGGAGADTISTAGGAGGSTTNATMGFPGQDGGGSSTANANQVSGSGGSSAFGAGGQAVTTASGTGKAGTNYGAGGSGGKGAPATGGAGSNGAILVEWYN